MTRSAKDTFHETKRRADANIGDVEPQLAAAYMCDKLGKDVEALHYYELASVLKIPKKDEKKFLMCYGSTLTNVGRTADALSTLKKAATLYPKSSEIKVFLALALRAAEKHEEAFNALFEAAILEAGDTGFGGFSKSISSYFEAQKGLSAK